MKRIAWLNQGTSTQTQGNFPPGDFNGDGKIDPIDSAQPRHGVQDFATLNCSETVH
jgi:hypothetical protein